MNVKVRTLSDHFSSVARYMYRLVSKFVEVTNAENIGALPPFPYIENFRWTPSGVMNTLRPRYKDMYIILYYICHCIPLHHSSLTHFSLQCQVVHMFHNK